ncbi:hypothetical protein MKX67_03910 [Cytobacillus sp. FSL W7-1323]|uniref:Uncharacterized protein n=1 Tax=Cytobacillus kochii TaxID=859143 RepID=A0A248TFV3_9BACI|nr:hypothetical protein [Cytobacillus kochii]ASV66990.1 hypothetical protein CKF48_06400 [Cytobacillus kochii]MDQ0185233.1 hypothetical protein [Cytobacillus kochii]
MALIILLLFILTVVIIGRLYKAKEVIRKLSWWERIYTVILYVGLFGGLIIGMSELKDWVRQFDLIWIYEFSIQLILLLIGIWIVTSILSRLLPEGIMKNL